MNYELAKKLKDSGFPQTGLKYTWYYSTKPMGLFNSGEEYLDVKNHPERIVAPTLEELIEACGDDFVELKYWWNEEVGKVGITKTWRARDRQSRFPNWFVGSTPTEAVANLWLAIHSVDKVIEAEKQK